MEKGKANCRARLIYRRRFKALNGAEGIYEAFVDFEKEVSVVAARTL